VIGRSLRKLTVNALRELRKSSFDSFPEIDTEHDAVSQGKNNAITSCIQERVSHILRRVWLPKSLWP
jgi:hypothetical protein